MVAGWSPDSGEANNATSAPFSTSMRILVLALLLLLSAYTVFAGSRFRRSAVQAVAAVALKPEAGKLGAQTALALAPLHSAAEAQMLLSSREPSLDPLDLAEMAMKLSGAAAQASAVVVNGHLVAATGVGDGLEWVDGASALGGKTVRMGPASGHSRFFYVAAPVQTRVGEGQLLIATPQTRLDGDASKPSSEESHLRILVEPDGHIVKTGALAGAFAHFDTVDQAFGVSLAEMKADAQGGRETSTVGPDHRKLRLTVEPAGATGLIALVAAPEENVVAAERRSLTDDGVALMAPLAIGLCLALVVFRQTRKAEEAQKVHSESERKFRSAVEAAHCGIWEWRIRDDVVDLSDVTGVMFGWGGGGLAQGQEVLARIAPEHRDRVRKALIDAAEHGAFDVTFKVPSANGDAWIDARGQGIGERDELGYSAILGVALDVTEERMAQARALSAEARLNDAIESVSEAFVLWDRRGRLVMCNRNYREFFSLDPRVLKPGASRAMIQQVAEISVRAHRPAPEASPGVREAEMMDGRWLQISERRTSDGGLVMTAADITAVKRQEEARRRNELALQRAIVRLEENGGQLAELAAKYEQEKIRAQQANAAKSEFLANMSHELRTPLNAINGFSEMMARQMLGPLGDKRYVEYSQDIHDSGQHLLALINDILDMAKIEAGKHSLHLEDVDIANVAQEAVRLMRNRAEDGSLTLLVEMADLPPVEADHRAIKQVLLNLLSNAVKFTPRGGQVKVSARRLQSGVQISVMDTGIGISKEDLARLAQPFQQVESQLAKTQQGTGLGLALSKSLVEMHEGRFEMASEPGRGTTVSFSLPIRQRQAPDRAVSAAAARDASAA